jgi:hypothetical protein
LAGDDRCLGTEGLALLDDGGESMVESLGGCQSWGARTAMCRLLARSAGKRANGQGGSAQSPGRSADEEGETHDFGGEQAAGERTAGGGESALDVGGCRGR